MVRLIPIVFLGMSFLLGCRQPPPEIMQIKKRNLVNHLISRMRESSDLEDNFKCVNNGEFNFDVAAKLTGESDLATLEEALKEIVFVEGLSKLVISENISLLIAVSKTPWEKLESGKVLVYTFDRWGNFSAELDVEEHQKIISDLKAGHLHDLDSMESMKR